MTPIERPPSKESPKYRPFTDVFIANRGISALLAARVCEANGMRAFLPYSFTDPYTEATRMADAHANRGWHAIPIGGTSPAESYANVPILLETARVLQKEAQSKDGFGVYFGWGFISEKAELISQFEQAGIRVIAPPSHAIERLGNKLESRKLAEQLGIPVVKGSYDITTPEQALDFAKSNLSFPVMLKDPEGGGGMDNAVGYNDEEVLRGFQRLRSREGNKQIFIEQYVENGGHVEVQLGADQYGNVVSLGHRDCTLQRRYQKFIEESPSPRISQRMARKIEGWAVQLAKAAEYQTVGTAEFILDMDELDQHGDPKAYFMEFNTRLQVENRVTELRTGISIPELLFQTAAGLALPFSQNEIPQQGHAMQIRVYAEDPYNEFIPTPGKIDKLTIPHTQGLIVDSAYRSGDTISGEFDPTILHALFTGKDREQVVALVQKMLPQFTVRGQEVTTNIPFVLKMLDSREFLTGEATTTFAESKWQRELRRRQDTTGTEFAVNGEYIPHHPSLLFDPKKLPMDVRPPTQSGRSFSEGYREAMQKTGRNSAAEYGIVSRDGIHLVFFGVDYNNFRQGGPFGEAEGNTFTDAVELAVADRDNPLWIVSYTPSGGIDQGQNNIGLIQMTGVVSDVNYLNPPMHIHVVEGYELGGVPVVMTATANLIIGIDRPGIDTRIGITGPFMEYLSIYGVAPPSDKAADIYRELGDVQSIHRALAERNIDVILPSVEEASDFVTHMAHILGESGAQKSVHVFRPKEDIGSHETSRPVAASPATPDLSSRAWLNKSIGSLWRYVPRQVEQMVYHGQEKSLRPSERLDLIEHPFRPHAADIIDTESGFLDDALLLATKYELSNGLYVYPSIIAAIGKLGEFPVLILAHQSQRVRDPQTGEVIKQPSTPRAQDLMYAMHMIKDIAEPRGLPIITIGDTEGLSSKDSDEDRNIVLWTGRLMRKLDNYPHPVISNNIGGKGSGGGAIFIIPGDGSGWAKNALGYVSPFRVNMRIVGKRWVDRNSSPKDKQDLRRYTDQFKDATAEAMKERGQVDVIYPEGPGGAHLNPRVLPQAMREFALTSLRELTTLSKEELLERRRQRLQYARTTASTKRL